MMAAETKSTTNTRDLSFVPEITFGFVEEIVRKCSKSGGSNELTKGYKYFSEKYISNIRGN